MSVRGAITPHQKSVRMAVHLLFTILLLIEGVHVVIQVQQHNPLNCSYSHPLLPDAGFVVCGVVALLAGRFAGAIGFLQEWPGGDTDGSRATGQAALACLFLLLTLIWVYEAIGLTNVRGLEPITYYVRCSVAHDIARTGIGTWTYVIVATISFLVGHWFWPWNPNRRANRASAAAPRP
ncbi:MAG: hypothetical protein ACHQ7M_11545 [Chloroflexota bacterium]